MLNDLVDRPGEEDEWFMLPSYPPQFKLIRRGRKPAPGTSGTGQTPKFEEPQIVPLGRRPSGQASPGTLQELYEKELPDKTVPWDMPGGLGGAIRQLMARLRLRRGGR